MEAKINANVNVDGIVNRFKDFYEELNELCIKYDVEPQMAHDDETNENYVAINIKDFVKEEDIDINVDK